MKLDQLVPMLLAKDMQQTISFYTDVLGFELVGTLGDPVGWCSLRKDDVSLMFVWDEPHEHAPGEEHDHPEPTLTGVLYFYPRNVTELHDEVVKRWSICEDLAIQPHGMREFAVLDPNGYRLRFGEAAH